MKTSELITQLERELTQLKKNQHNDLHSAREKIVELRLQFLIVQIKEVNLYFLEN